MYIVTSYRVRIAGESAAIELESDITPNALRGSRIARIEFGPDFEPSAFINRGGFLSVSRPIGLLAPFLSVLQNESPVNLDDDGNLSTGAEPVGEVEDDELEPAPPPDGDAT